MNLIVKDILDAGANCPKVSEVFSTTTKREGEAGVGVSEEVVLVHDRVDDDSACAARPRVVGAPGGSPVGEYERIGGADSGRVDESKEGCQVAAA